MFPAIPLLRQSCILYSSPLEWLGERRGCSRQMKDGGSGGEDTFGVSGGVRVDGSGDWNRWKRGEVVVGKRERVLMSGKREGAECLRKFERTGEQRGGIEWGGDSV